MSRIVFAGIKHPEHWRREVLRRISEVLPDLRELLQEAGMYRAELIVLADGRAELRISDPSCYVKFTDSADAHPENPVSFDLQRLFG